MQTFAKTVVLRDESEAGAVVVRAPDAPWAGKILSLLGHKEEIWNWQNGQALRRQLEVETRFFLLHRDGEPFANVTLAEARGVGFLSHVWTAECRRGAGASSVLLQLALDDFRTRGGQALFLGTRFDSPAWHAYGRRGFAPVEARSGYMALYRDSENDFVRGWFQAGAAEIAPLAWPDWPASAPLFLGNFPGRVRLSSGGIVGRRSSEGPLLSLLREEDSRRQAGGSPRTYVLRAKANGAVFGLASAIEAPAWPDTRLVDLYCHPDGWPRAGELLARLPDEHPRSLAYADADFRPKRQALEAAGFKAAATLPRWVATDAAKTGSADMIVYIK